MLDHLTDHRRAAAGGFVGWVGAMLVVAGIAMLAWAGWYAIDGAFSQWEERIAFVTLPPHPDLSRDSPPIQTRRTTPTPLIGSALAILEIPRVGLSTVVLHGSDDRTLRRGPGHLENTPLPGEHGNVVIAGHRDTFFRALRDVKSGDDIFVDSPMGRLHYQVTSTRVVSSRDLSVLDATGIDVLSLITCYPFWVLGPAPDRFVVRATRADAPTAAALPARAISMPLSTPASIVAPAPVSTPPTSPPRALDDQSLVRLAIERFRAIYNARLISHPDGGEPLRFARCDVALEGDHALATCQTATAHTNVTRSEVWTLMLDHVADEWAIRSTMTNDVTAIGSPD